MTKKLVFCDTETSGLDERTCDLVELSYAVEDGPVRTLYFGVESVPPVVDDIIEFTKRGIAGLKSDKSEVDRFLEATANQTLVAANPFFDRSVLITHNLWRMHYRTLDVETYAMKALRTPYVPSMEQIYDALTKRGYSLVKPDHTSRNDVLAMRQAFWIIKYQL